ncbi:hypothetical protein RRG08_002512 [Elysia crispata]|uniref:Uncharacterized protein n=1 Tax=Elysia crispata TaxID=231223 RepID=A0AAE1A8E5_9GAST|nr:hypothetical protein RRG08_002512 [Elysia crispata]
MRCLQRVITGSISTNVTCADRSSSRQYSGVVDSTARRGPRPPASHVLTEAAAVSILRLLTALPGVDHGHQRHTC